MSIRPKQQGGFQGELSGAAPGPQRAQSRTPAQRARMRIAAGSGHIGSLHSTGPVLLEVRPALRIHADHPERRALPPILGHAPCISPDLIGPLPSPMQPTRTHKRPRRRTLSLTIASQTIASSPDGSEISSAASSACGPPAATGGGGGRFRASSTVTSSSSPCNHTSVIPPRTRSSKQANEGRRALATATHPYAACGPVAVYP